MTKPEFTYAAFMCIVRYYPILAMIFAFIVGMVPFSGIVAAANMRGGRPATAIVWIMLAAACVYTVIRMAELFATCSATAPLGR